MGHFVHKFEQSFDAFLYLFTILPPSQVRDPLLLLFSLKKNALFKVFKHALVPTPVRYELSLHVDVMWYNGALYNPQFPEETQHSFGGLNFILAQLDLTILILFLLILCARIYMY